MFRQPLLFAALAANTIIAAIGLWDAEGLANFASSVTNMLFDSRGWFIMLSVTAFVLVCIGLAFSRYGRMKLGGKDDEPEFSTITWITMLFSAGMGVGLLYWGTAEPLFHFTVSRNLFDTTQEAATAALKVTNFHWGIHAWTIYAMLALILAYFSYRKQNPMLVSTPIRSVFRDRQWSGIVASLCDLISLIAVSIGVAGSIAMGIFQVQSGVESIFGLENTGTWMALGIFLLLFIAYIFPLTVDLASGMALIANACMAIAIVLLLYVLLVGPTHYMMNAIVDTLGEYGSEFLTRGLKTYTFVDQSNRSWFKDWTLTYMIWWIAWAPFVSVFIARISRGRTIREFLVTVILIPTLFSIVWFGVFGGIGFYEILEGTLPLLETVQTNLDAVTFKVLERLPLSIVTVPTTIVISFMFVVTSVVSATYVLAMFSEAGNENPKTRSKLIWGTIVGVLGIVAILTGNIEAVRAIIALGAMPFSFIILLLLVCLLKDLKRLKHTSHGKLN
ncbi:BCCT family transporter [Geitlerinema sp. PCC 9228]|uniref:BCCT family transporter n=1 Tax=Geitlerinema sp. PCC 9228 TaxID=111611 RepID=UPI0008F9E371|nr:BCCT family transporter [Geitlerinema sp. PCC 9228]